MDTQLRDAYLRMASARIALEMYLLADTQERQTTKELVDAFLEANDRYIATLNGRASPRAAEPSPPTDGNSPLQA